MLLFYFIIYFLTIFIPLFFFFNSFYSSLAGRPASVCPPPTSETTPPSYTFPSTTVHYFLIFNFIPLPCLHRLYSLNQLILSSPCPIPPLQTGILPAITTLYVACAFSLLAPPTTPPSFQPLSCPIPYLLLETSSQAYNECSLSRPRCLGKTARRRRLRRRPTRRCKGNPPQQPAPVPRLPHPRH